MTNIAQFPRPRLRLQCSACGAATDAACDCGVAYLAPRELAARALAANPEKTNEDIAQELGIGAETVRRVRKAKSPNGEVEKPVAQPSVSLADDFLTPADADRGLRTIAGYLDGRLVNPPPGIRACYIEAMARASLRDVKIIEAAADFLFALRSAIK